MKRRLSLRLWATITVLAALILTLVLGGLAPVLVRNATPDPLDAERVLMDVTSSPDRWFDPAWQATIRSEAAQLHLDLTLQGAGGQTLLDLHSPGPAPAGAGASLLARTGTWVLKDSAGRLLGTITWASPAQAVPGAAGDDLELLVRIIIMILLCAGAGVWIGFWLVRPLLALGRAAEQLAAGELEVALPASPVKEVQALIDTFAYMVAELKRAGLQQEAIEQERRIVLGAVSHDLRTPLFSLRGHLEGILAGLASTPEKLKQYVGHALMRVENLERLVGDLLAFTKLNDLKLPVRPEPLAVGPYLQSVTEGIALRAEARGVAVRLEPPSESCTVMADRTLIWRVFDNLLDNAIRYSPAGGLIRLRWRGEGGMVRIMVEDAGPGIPEEDLPHLFMPLFQGDAARTHHTGGAFGLGLAIAHRIVAAHHGTISAENLPEGGARFTVCLPETRVEG